MLLDGDQASPGSNYIRSSLISGLNQIFSSDAPKPQKSSLAIEFADEVAVKMQLSYSRFKKRYLAFSSDCLIDDYESLI